MNPEQLQPELQIALENACDDLNRLLGDGERITPEQLLAKFAKREQVKQLYNPLHTIDELRELFFQEHEPIAALSSPVLVVRGLSAFRKWALAGFSLADPKQQERRLAACQNCEHYTKAPKTLLYSAINSGKICSLCGCSVQKKIRLTTENCPARNVTDHEKSRWGEKFVGK